MYFHGISKLVTVSTHYSPNLLQQFYTTVHFSTERKRTMTWMCVDSVCEATLAEFGALFGLDKLPFAPTNYIHLQCQKLIPAELGIHHRYPPRIGICGNFPSHSCHPEELSCLEVWEKGEVRERMVNFLHHIVYLKERKRPIDILDYMWQEMHLVVLKNKVPVYGPYL